MELSLMEPGMEMVLYEIDLNDSNTLRAIEPEWKLLMYSSEAETFPSYC